MLTEVGASERKDQIYRYLATKVSATEDEITSACRSDLAGIRTALADLERRGLVTRTAELPRRYVAAPPSVVEQLLTDRQRDLQHARETLAELTTQYYQHPRNNGAGEVIEVVTGARALQMRLRQLELSGRHEMCCLAKPPYVAFDVAQARHDVLASPPVRYRAVYDSDSLSPANLAVLRETHVGHEELRTHPGIPVKLIIADRTTAVLPLGPGDDSTAAGLIVHASGLLDALTALFEHVWAVAAPLHLDDPLEERPESAGSPLSAPDRHLMSLLLAGLTDDAIAAQLKVSRRTVQRRLRGMIDSAGVRTRTELIWHASRRNWI